MSNGIIELYVAEPALEKVTNELKSINLNLIIFNVQEYENDSNESRRRLNTICRLAKMFQYQNLKEMKAAILDGFKEATRKEIIDKAFHFGKMMVSAPTKPNEKNDLDIQISLKDEIKLSKNQKKKVKKNSRESSSVNGGSD